MSKNGNLKRAISLYQTNGDHQSEGYSKNGFVALLKACSRLREIEEGQEIHSKILKLGMLEQNVYLGNALINMYMKCGCIFEAEESFNRVPDHIRNVVSWNTLITGYVDNQDAKGALDCLEQMQKDGIHPDCVTLICSLKACSLGGTTVTGQELHSEIARMDILQRDVRVGSTLVDMYVKCGCVAKAQEVFDILPRPTRDVVAWNSLIAGYADAGLGAKALDYLITMQNDGISPDPITFNSSLKACACVSAISTGMVMHGDIAKMGYLENDVFLNSSLVDMYAKCGHFTTALEILEKFRFQDTVSWNAVIAGLVEEGYDEEATNCFEQMKGKGICPDVATFNSMLKSCGNWREIGKAREIHAEVIKKGCPCMDNAAVDAYARCGLLEDARDLLESKVPPLETTMAWNALIVGYINEGDGMEALRCFQRMQEGDKGILPDGVSFVYGMKACSQTGDMTRGQRLHAEMTKLGVFEREDESRSVGSMLVGMYAKLGSFADAEKVFAGIWTPDMVCWTALIAGYVENGLGAEALDRLEEMGQERGAASAGELTYVYGLQACGMIGDIEKGREIHSASAKKGFWWMGSWVMIEMYGRCGAMAEAEQVFEKQAGGGTNSVDDDSESWRAIMAAFSECGNGDKVLQYFLARQQRQNAAPPPCAASYLLALKACGSTTRSSCRRGAIHADLVKRFIYREKGLQMHSQMIFRGLERESFVVFCRTVADMYAKCGSLAEARNVVEKLPIRSRDSTAWTLIIGWYADEGMYREAMDCVDKMQEFGVIPAVSTFTKLVVKICGGGGGACLEMGGRIHGMLVKRGLEGEAVVANKKLLMDARCEGRIDEEEEEEEAWKSLLEEMMHHGSSSSDSIAAIVSCTKACSAVGSTHSCRNLHIIIVKRGLDTVALAGNSLVDAYSKLGFLEDAQAVFDDAALVVPPDVVAWTALITGYAQVGNIEDVRRNFERMQTSECATEPNAVTLASVLNAYCHGGLVEEGEICMWAMASTSLYGMVPSLEHYTSMVDLYVRADAISKAVWAIRSMPVQASAVMWHTVLGVCQRLGNVGELGKCAFYHSMELDGEDAIAHVCASNIICRSRWRC